MAHMTPLQKSILTTSFEIFTYLVMTLLSAAQLRLLHNLCFATRPLICLNLATAHQMRLLKLQNMYCP